MSQYKVGDRVKWESQAKGSMTKKVGNIIEVVVEGKLPKKHTAGLKTGMGSPRKGDSYVVDVNGKTYWPRTGMLKTVKRVAA